MRLIHTADWHLGHRLRDFPRDAEHLAFLTWLRATLHARAIDVLIVAGDLFDAAIPPPEAAQLWHRFLVEAWRDDPALQIVAVAGNHDSPARLDAARPLYDALGRLHVVGSPRPERMAVEVRGRGGERAWIAAVPYLRPADLPSGADSAPAIAAVYREVVAAIARRRSPGEPIIATGHCYVAGGALSELSERRVQRGNQEALPVEVFPPEVAYVALGHLHLAQSVGGRDHVRYAGAPLPLAVGERAYPSAVTEVEFDREQVTRIESIAVPRAVELVRIPDRGALALPELIARLRALPARAPDDDPAQLPFLEVEARLDAPHPGVRAELAQATDDRAVRLVCAQVSYAGSGDSLADTVEGGLRGLDDLAPAEVFARRWRAQLGADPDAATAAHFAHLAGLAADPAAAEAWRDARRVKAGLAASGRPRAPAAVGAR